MSDLDFKMNEDGELVIGGVDDEPLIRKLLVSSRDFERALITEYLQQVADGQPNSLFQTALEMIKTEIENEKHVQFHMDRDGIS